MNKGTLMINGVNYSGGESQIDYSIEEQDTGLKWIDGKKVYQSTIQTKTPVTKDGTYSSKVIDISALDIESICYISANAAVSNITFPIPSATTLAGRHCLLLINITSNQILLWNNFGSLSNTSCTITIRYTKKTDVNVLNEMNGSEYMNRGTLIVNGIDYSNAGISTRKQVDYSTDEQDTGLKWTDGKPIYQKTIVTRTPTVVTDGTYPTATSVDLTELNFETICDYDAFVKRNDSVVAYYSLLWINTNGRQCMITLNSGTQQLFVMCNDKTISNCECIVTIKYTKK